MSHAAVLPRIKTRRRHWKPPSGYTVFFIAFRILVLGNMVFEVHKLMEGDTFMVGFLMFWIAFYLFINRMDRRVKQFEEAIGMTLRVPHGVWTMIGALWLIFVCIWTTTW